MSNKKTVGTLVPVFSLRSSQQQASDQGTFTTAVLFLDWLKKNGQNAWQVLPLNETQLETGSAMKHVPSPYKGYGIGLSPRYLPSSYAETKPTLQEKKEFITLHSYWITDYALFCALRDHYRTDDWRVWDAGLRKRKKETLAAWSDKLIDKVTFYITQQWQLHKAFGELRSHATHLGIALISDLPYYVSVKSPLVWAHQEVFHIEKDGSMSVVSGIPNTSGTHFGRQVWGHPLYNWQSREKVVVFWKMRLRYQALLFHSMRIDHAKAFFSYGVMDPHREKNDRYEAGPGSALFKELIDFCHDLKLKVFAEDSGDITNELRDNLKKLRVPGILIYRFAMKKLHSLIVPKYADIANYPENCVAYTTTHDTEPMLGYLKLLQPEQKQALADTAGVDYHLDDKKLVIQLRDAIVASPAQTVIIPIQDWLLTTDRINIPGTEREVGDTNWHYQLEIPVEKLPEM